MATITTAPNGNHIIRVYAGRDAVSGRYRRPQMTLPASMSMRQVTKEAVAFERRVSHDDTASASGLSIAVYLDDYLDAAEDLHTMSPTTIEAYRSYVRCHVAPWIGDVSLSDLTSDDLDSLYRALMSRGGRDGSGLSGATVAKLHVFLHRALSRAVTRGMIISNPVDQATKPKATHEEAYAWDEQETAKLIHALDTCGNDKLMIAGRLALATGTRRGEVAAFTRGSEIERTQSVHVGKSLAETGRGSGRTLTLKEPKSKTSVRTISTDTDTWTMLMEWRARQEDELTRAGVKVTRDTPLLSDDGSWVHPSWITDNFTRLLRDNDLQGHFHTCRHTHATYLLSNGVPIKVVQQRLGHSSPAITLNVYGHVLPDSDTTAAATIGDVIERIGGANV